jgi:hypothetical protein
MIKKILFLLLTLFVSFSACKKAADNETKNPANDELLGKFLANIESGSASWIISSTVTVFYDKDNKVLFTRNMDGNDYYWKFSHYAQIQGYNSLNVIVYPNIYPPSFVSANDWELSYENGKYYYTDSDKMPFENVTSTSFDLVTTNVLPLSYNAGNTTYPADHAVKTLHFKKM